MKKILLLFIIVLLITGCKAKNTMVCSGTSYNDGSKIKSVLTAKIKDNKIDNIESKMTFKNNDEAKEFCNLYNLVNDLSEGEELTISCNKNIVIIKDYKALENVLENYADEKYTGISKNEFKKLMKQKGYSCK